MYLIINGNKHTCSKRIKEKDTVKFLTVTPAPKEISGIVQMFRNDGFLMCEDDLDSFERKSYTGTLLVVTNKPEPKPVDETKKPEYRMSMLEEENTAIHEQLAVVDETAIELYEANLAQEEINAAQDEALIEIYEMMEV